MLALKRTLAPRRKAEVMFENGQQVTWGSWFCSYTGEVIGVGSLNHAGHPLLRVRYYADPGRFGHPVAVEIDLPAHQARVRL